MVSRLCNRHRTLGGECSVESKTLFLLHHTDSSEGGDGELYSSSASTGINNRGGKHDLAVNLVYWLKFLTQRRKDIMSKKKRGRALERECANIHQLSPLISVLLLGSKKAPLMFQPYLCKSHFAVQSQWRIAPSRFHTLWLPYTLIVCLASISRISSFHYLFRIISGTSFPLLLAAFSARMYKNTQP